MDKEQVLKLDLEEILSLDNKTLVEIRIEYLLIRLKQLQVTDETAFEIMGKHREAREERNKKAWEDAQAAGTYDSYQDMIYDKISRNEY